MHAGAGVLAIVGSVCMTLALALKLDLPQKPATPFGAMMLLSFTATTVGYGGAAWCVAQAVIQAAS